MITEDQLEQLTLNWFQQEGYGIVCGYDIALDVDKLNSERTSYKEVILPKRLRAALYRLNPQLPDATVEEVIHLIQTFREPNVVQANRESHKWLLQGVPVAYKKDGETTHDRAFLVNFEGDVEQNEFTVVNQFTVQGIKRLRRPDIVVFVNGLPLSVIELKNPANQQADIWDAYHQLQTYKDEISDLFIFNEALVISDGGVARVGSLTADKERFMPWRAIKHENDRPILDFELEKVVRGFFDRKLFLEYVRDFVLFEYLDKQLIKKVAGYHQFHGVREAIVAAINASASDGDRRGGVFWHTQGSGKSISMTCLAGKLMSHPAMHNPTLVVVTDRNDLDGQLFETFINAKELLAGNPVQAENRDTLRDMLANCTSGGIFFTTIQKFSLEKGEREFPMLSDRSNIVVIADECHRSQYGFKAELNMDVKAGRVFDYGYAQHMRDALPNATFSGFTGTPIEQDDKNTIAVFGEYSSIYDIQQAVMDGATVPIYYESRLAKLDLNNDELEQLNEEVDEVIEDEEDQQAEQTKSKWAALAALVGAEPRIKEVAEDLVNHFEARSDSVEGKAMVVGMSREICVQMFNAIIEIRPDWAGTQLENGAYDPADGVVRIVMTGSASDKRLLQPHIYSKPQKKALEKRFKKTNDQLKLVIVRDMWLTGFDAPSVHTMYVDKPMKGHNLMQAIARVNRVFKDKQGGLVVDYIGIGNELKDAMKTYTRSNGKGRQTIDAHEALSVLLEKLDVCRGLMHGFDYSNFIRNALSLLPSTANHVLQLEDGKKRFLDTVTAISKAYSLCGTLDEAVEWREEIAFFQAVKAFIIKATTTEKKLSQESKDAALRQILSRAVVPEGVIDIFETAGLDKPDMSILSDEFLEDIKNLEHRNLAVELLQKLLNDEIKSRSRSNETQKKKFSERLEASLVKYRNRAIETSKVIEELIQMAKDFREVEKRGSTLGLNHDELAFYDALAENESAIRELSEEILITIAQELTKQLRNSTTVDWQHRDSVRARMRNLVRRILRRYKYPPDETAQAVEEVLHQAESLADEWSGELET